MTWLCHWENIFAFGSIGSAKGNKFPMAQLVMSGDCTTGTKMNFLYNVTTFFKCINYYNDNFARLKFLNFNFQSSTYVKTQN